MSAPPADSAKSSSSESPKPSDSLRQERQVLSPGDLKERLPAIEAKTSEHEKAIKKILTLEEENRFLNERLKNFNRAIFSILFHAVEPSDPRFVKRRVEVLMEGLERLNDKRG